MKKFMRRRNIDPIGIEIDTLGVKIKDLTYFRH